MFKQKKIVPVFFCMIVSCPCLRIFELKEKLEVHAKWWEGLEHQGAVNSLTTDYLLWDTTLSFLHFMTCLP